MVCVGCKKIYRPERNGVYIEEMMPLGNEDIKWVPYKIWVGDLLKCPGCGHEVVAGIPMTPLGEHYQEDYYRELKQNIQHRLVCQVEDCGPLQLGDRYRSKSNEEDLQTEQKRQQVKMTLRDARVQLEQIIASAEEMKLLLGEDDDDAEQRQET